ncbi:MAG: FAD-binding oxidoreductase, partial [Gemmatimonadetes bacterium]|nr:FAD-binding oxidoreductase [Gemmatimonadota bacterium]
VPGINSEGLRGGTYSPDDGQVSPLRAASSFVDVARRLGAEARFGERVTGFKVRGGKVHAVVTSAGEYAAATVVIASGAEARETGELLRLTFPVVPDSHEAGITAPVRPFLGPLVVDMRAGPEGKTANFYFGQNAEGQIIFCYTPSQLFYGTSREPTSEFLPVLARRMIGLIPAMKDVPVRRTWRGLYPMTPDGIIIVDRVRELEGVVVAIGMCGQGMMLGPGVARCVSGMVTGSGPTIDAGALAALSLYRDFHKGRVEALK